MADLIKNVFDSEEAALWEDALDLMSEQGFPENVLAMLEKCQLQSLEKGVLTVSTSQRIILRKLTTMTQDIEAVLSEAAFEPIHFNILFSDTHTQTATTQTAEHSYHPEYLKLQHPEPLSSQTSELPENQVKDFQVDMEPNISMSTFVSNLLNETAPDPHLSTNSTRTYEEISTDLASVSSSTSANDSNLIAQQQLTSSTETLSGISSQHYQQKVPRNPLVECISDSSSKLTFDRFVKGDENEYAYQGALQVANGKNKSYNPLFIYGRSGLGKTHLLRAIQNYIAQNDPSRVCVYRDASTFISEFTNAISDKTNSAAAVLRENYKAIDVLIIDDIQNLIGKTGTISFFYDTFNALIDSDKQIVLAADRTPAELGAGNQGFDERVTSRISQGFSISIQVPNYELKLRLITTFCDRMRSDAIKEHIPNFSGTIPQDIVEYMAQRAGTNIRAIEGFCQRCLFMQSDLEKNGLNLSIEQVNNLARQTWPESNRIISIQEVQKHVADFYNISREDLIGQKRAKHIMMPRHFAIYLCRELCDRTLADIGTHFGNRSHATVLNSLQVVDSTKSEDKIFFDQITRLREMIVSDTPGH